MRLSKAAVTLNTTWERAAEFLSSSKDPIDGTITPNVKITDSQYDLLLSEFQSDISQKKKSDQVLEAKRQQQERLVSVTESPQENSNKEAILSPQKNELENQERKIKIKEVPKDQLKDVESLIEKNLRGKDSVISTQSKKSNIEVEPEISVNEAPKEASQSLQDTPLDTKEVDSAIQDNGESDTIITKKAILEGPKKTGEVIDLSQFNKPKVSSKKQKVASSSHLENSKNRKKRKRILGDKSSKPHNKQLPTDSEVQQKIAETLDKLTSKGKSKSSKLRKLKRDERKEKAIEAQMKQDEQSAIIKATEFVTVSEFANMMSVSVNDVISSCMQLGIMVTMNQRLDAETLTIVADEFNFKVEFVSADLEDFIEEEEESEENLVSRPPIVTVMGHVDHGKTSLLDYIRKANVIAGEAGGITQHIAAYGVTLSNDRKITFIDTPGHEAFTAMRARGAQVTDVVIIVIAVDDDVMPQTKEAIAHAQAANVPIIFAFNKMDKPDADPDKIKNQLSSMNLLVEDWGGKYQSQEVSAKTGSGIDELLEKVLLESDLLNLNANPEKLAKGTVLEASLDKGKGYVTTVLVQEGNLKIGDFVLAGRYTGKIKALFNERDQKINHVSPSTPAILLGLNGAPQAGDVFYVRSDEKEAKGIAAKRDQLQREQSVRSQKHITLDEIGRRLAIGDFKELNIIVKGDVDGSIEALSDSLLKLSTEKIQINVIHKGVGQITESDVLLASASDAIIIGFQVRPSIAARKLAEKEAIDIRLYSIIYDTINSIKDAIEGMHEPDMIESVLGNIEIRNVFKLTKVGVVAGCYVLDGQIIRNSKVRLIRDGIVIYTGSIDSLKRFKEDVKEVQKSYECGLTLKNFNDIKVGDIVEAFEEVEKK